MGSVTAGSTNREAVKGNRPPAAPLLFRLDAPDVPPVRLNRPLTIVGSKGHSHLRIMSRSISGSHAVLLNVGNNVFLRDLMSRTHTYVNDRQVKECRLKYGDVLRFGEMQFRFTDADVLRHSIPAEQSASAALLPADSQEPRALESPIFVIGRNAGADLHLDGAQVSQVHAVLYQKAGVHVLRDLSRYATHVNGRSVRSVDLKNGDRIEIGGFHFRFLAGAATADVQDEMVQLPEIQGTPEPVLPTEGGPDTPAAGQDGDLTGEQYVFAPEPEILNEPAEARPADPEAPLRQFDSESELHNAGQTDLAGEDLWHLDAPEVDQIPPGGEDRADEPSPEQAESAEDLLDWGITAKTELPPNSDLTQPLRDVKDARTLQAPPPSNRGEETPSDGKPDDSILMATPDDLACDDLTTSGHPKNDTEPGAQVGDEIALPVADATFEADRSVQATVPILLEPVDLDALAKSSPAVIATSATPPVELQAHRTVETADSAAAAKRTILASGALPRTTSQVTVNLGSPVAATHQETGTSLRAVEEILAGEVISMVSTGPRESLTAEPAASGRRLWLALAFLAVLIAVGMVVWIYFGPQLKSLLVQ